MSLTPSQLGQQITECCRALGFAEAGIADAAPIDAARADAYRAWIAAGKHGEMHYLAENIEKRLNPGELMLGARSVVMVADQYQTRGHTPVPTPPGHGRIARYARGDDYHEVMKKRLHVICDALRAEHPAHEFRAFVDTAPVHERELALRAGLGWIGKNTLLINPRKGSWLFLGGVLTTLELAPPPTQRGIASGGEPDHCGTCTRCIDACPTGAITPHSVDARKCISGLTIEQRSPIDPALAPKIGDWLYGCDVCQEVCPHNSPRPPNVDVGAPHPAYAPRFDSLDPLEVLAWTPEDRARVLKGSAMKRATLEMLKRNARIVLANAGVDAPEPPGSA